MQANGASFQIRVMRSYKYRKKRKNLDLAAFDVNSLFHKKPDSIPLWNVLSKKSHFNFQRKENEVKLKIPVNMLPYGYR